MSIKEYINELPLCACGCGRHVTYSVNRFLQGHRAKGVRTYHRRNKGHTYSIEQRRANSEAQQRFWKKVSCDYRIACAEKSRRIYLQKTEEEKQCIIAKRRATILNYTSEEKARIRKAKQKSFAAKTEEEKIQLKRKIGNAVRCAFAKKTESALLQIYQRRKAGMYNRSSEAKQRTSQLHRVISTCAMTKRILEGHRHPGGVGYVSGTYFSHKNGKAIPYQSSYELLAYQLLEQLENVKSYDRCHFFILYEAPDAKRRRYFPDIFVEYTDGHSQVIEVKASNFLTDPLIIAKNIAAQKYCTAHNWSFSVWTEKESRIA